MKKRVLQVVCLVVLIIVLSGGISLTSWDQACEDATQCEEDMMKTCSSVCRLRKSVCAGLFIWERLCYYGICKFEFTIFCADGYDHTYVMYCGGTPCPVEP